MKIKGRVDEQVWHKVVGTSCGLVVGWRHWSHCEHCLEDRHPLARIGGGPRWGGCPLGEEEEETQQWWLIAVG